MDFQADIEIFRTVKSDERTLNQVHVVGDSIEEVISKMNDHLAVILARTAGRGGDIHIAAVPAEIDLPSEFAKDVVQKRPLESVYRTVMSADLADYIESCAIALNASPNDFIRSLVALSKKNSCKSTP